MGAVYRSDVPVVSAQVSKVDSQGPGAINAVGPRRLAHPQYPVTKFFQAVKDPLPQWPVRLLNLPDMRLHSFLENLQIIGIQGAQPVFMASRHCFGAGAVNLASITR